MKAQRLQRDFFGFVVVHVGVSPIGKARMASPYRLPGGEPGIGGCKRKIGRGFAHPLGRRSSAPGADHRRSAQAAPGDARKTGETRFFDCWGRKGNPFGPLKTAPVPARRSLNLLRGAEQRLTAPSPPRRTIPHEHEMFETPRRRSPCASFRRPAPNAMDHGRAPHRVSDRYPSWAKTPRLLRERR